MMPFTTNKYSLALMGLVHANKLFQYGWGTTLYTMDHRLIMIVIGRGW
jgi:hypothetical protein